MCGIDFFEGRFLHCILFSLGISSTRLFVIQSHEYRTEMHQRLILWCISKILVQPFLSFGAFETAFGASIFGFGAFETVFGASILDFGAFETVWNCQHPFSQKTPKILTAVDQAARTESMLLSR